MVGLKLLFYFNIERYEYLGIFSDNIGIIGK